MLIFITRKVGNNNMAKVQVVKSKKIQPTNAFDKSPEERLKWAIKNKDKLMNPVPFNMIKAIYFKLGITEDANWDIYNDKYNSKD